MSILKKVAGINLIILVLYTAVIGLSTIGNYSLEFPIFMAMSIGLHVIINLVISISHFATKNNEYGRAFLLSSVMILVIGFSACFGGSSL